MVNKKRMIYLVVIAVLLSQFSCTWVYYKLPYLKVPFYAQEKPNYCGCACVQMWAAFNKKTVTQDEVYNDCDHNTSPSFLWRYSLWPRTGYGYMCWMDWWEDNAAYKVIAGAVNSIHNGQPAMVPIYSGIHMLLAIGFTWHEDNALCIPIADGMYYHDPWGAPYQFMSFDELFMGYFTPANETFYAIIDNQTSAVDGTANLDTFISLGGTYYGATSKIDPNDYQTLSISSSSITTRGNRKPPKSIKDLTDPTSPAFVPIPYPKNRKEVIDDLKYGIDTLFNHTKESEFSDENTSTPPIETILLDFLGENSKYQVGKIEKVINYSEECPHEYSWLIFLNDSENKNAARVTMHSDGLIGTCAAMISPLKTIIDKPEQEIFNALSKAIGNPVSKSNLNKMERVAFSSPIAQQIYPMWEMKIGNQLYYYCTVNDTVYEIDHKIPWKKDKNGNRPMIKSLVPDTNDFVPDSINDEILVFKKPGK